MAVDDVVPTVATTQAGSKPAFRSSADHAVQLVRPHGVRLIHRDPAELVAVRTPRA